MSMMENGRVGWLLMGAMIVFFRLHGRQFTRRDNRVGAVLLVWAIFSVVTALFTPFIDNAAHVGGFVPPVPSRP